MTKFKKTWHNFKKKWAFLAYFSSVFPPNKEIKWMKNRKISHFENPFEKKLPLPLPITPKLFTHNAPPPSFCIFDVILRIFNHIHTYHVGTQLNMYVHFAVVESTYVIHVKFDNRAAGMHGSVGLPKIIPNSWLFYNMVQYCRLLQAIYDFYTRSLIWSFFLIQPLALSALKQTFSPFQFSKNSANSCPTKVNYFPTVLDKTV